GRSPSRVCLGCQTWSTRRLMRTGGSTTLSTSRWSTTPIARWFQGFLEVPLEKRPPEEGEDDMPDEASPEATAVLGDRDLEETLAERDRSGEKPKTWDEVKKDLDL